MMADLRTASAAWLFLTLASVASAAYHICVTEDKRDLCDLTRYPNQEFACVYGQDRLDCVQMLINQKADLMSLPAEEAYAAGTQYKLQTIAREIRDTNQVGINRHDARYDAAVVVRKTSNIRQLSDLKGKSTCHTGYARNTGWNIPVATLRSKKILGRDCDDITAVSKLFGRSCLPGNWSNDPVLNMELKKRYPNLCDLCGTNCLTDDARFFGYEGALMCLIQTNADVAFTKQSLVRHFFQQNPSAMDLFSVLCANGTQVPVLSSCPWASRPGDFIVTRADYPAAELDTLRKTLVTHSRQNSPAQDFLFKVLYSNEEVLGFIEDQSGRTPKQLLNDQFPEYLQTLEVDLPSECKSQEVKICVSSEVENQKCEAFKLAALSQRLRPTPSCYKVSERTQCLKALRDKTADVLAVDTGFVFSGAKEYNLKPIMRELHNDTARLDQGVSYYAVAVIKTDSNISQISDLRKRKSCHTGLGRTAGWNIPVGTLVSSGQISGTSCELEEAVGRYFNGSCVPGAKVESLCQLCHGNEKGEQKCSASSAEQYSGYEGAFRCLVEGGGDVAFVKHLTPLILGDGRKPEWLGNYSPEDFSLLCPQGGRRPITDYQSCHWGSVKAHQVITWKVEPDDVLRTQLLLARAADRFGPHRPNVFFQLFDSFNNKSDLLFKNTATGLASFPLGTDANSTLGMDLYTKLQKVYCPNWATDSASSVRISWFTVVGLALITLRQCLS